MNVELRNDRRRRRYTGISVYGAFHDTQDFLTANRNDAGVDVNRPRRT
jgi:hypothetical protein